MNDKQDLPDDLNDDSWERSLLGSLEADSAPPDKAAIDQALAIARESFQSQTQVVEPESVADSEKLTRRSRVITKILVGVSAIAAAVMMFFQATDTSQRPTLGSMLDKTLEAKSLKLSVDRGGKTSDVLVSLASHVRWEESKTKYRIANSKEAWEIDASKGDPKPAKITWHDQETGKVDMLALLGVAPKQSKAWRDLVASESELVDGKNRYVFTSTAGQPVLHAYFAPASNELLEVRCWPNGWKANVPPARLLVVARDIVVDESTFVVAKKLSDDGRIGKIADSQGLVTLRPKMNKRWTPVLHHMLLKPGDWVRTDARGANATTLVTASAYKVIVGPASLVETISGNEIRLHRGEVNVVGSKSAKEELKITGPGETSVSVGKGKAKHFRVNAQRELDSVGKKPLWLAGYQGKTNVDATGSLIANIDGRETPLTVGYHKVRVEIRDQIARTTIEESFVNHTGVQLEGKFHFPLPQDASISGFGMWIGDELVEADVVEKQRAREIFETILREKRDPGLLEWTGGNIFKARVFPIQPWSEKRIKIVYTQVLPLTGNKFRYAYGLQSELLQTTPLRELELDVQVHSSLPIQSIGSSTHAVRTIQTDHSAKLEFEAQEYTPQRDFEVVCELNRTEKNLVVVPHRRGDDGYFLAQLALPEQTQWKRQTIADGEPLDVLIVCDTSASMDSVKRSDQHKFVTSLLNGLGEDDRFDIAFCDVDCQWQNNELVPVSEGNVDRAIDWIEKRTSLGWTDLDAMLASVLKRTKKSTQVVYVGDGIVSGIDADPQAFVNRLQRATKKAKGDFHCVSVGNSFESVVLNNLGRIGAGSVRGISGEQSSQKVALELLTEISNPRLTNLKLNFQGVDVAAVYPERLPNLSAGKQQILVGRYLPNGNDQSGELVVTGNLAGKPVKYSTSVSLSDAESGNSFIPRLWARGHLDHLLSQGSGPLVRDQVIALSEEFHIMTPYTSLLVLESDADRERFGVKRRMEIRDGEQFFADGREKSNYELLQKQMKDAGDWRIALRRSILSSLSQLGRDSNLFSETPQGYGAGVTGGYGGGVGSGGYVLNGGIRSPVNEDSVVPYPNNLSLVISGSTRIMFEQDGLDAPEEWTEELDSIEDANETLMEFESVSELAKSKFLPQRSNVSFQAGNRAIFSRRPNRPLSADSSPVSGGAWSGFWSGAGSAQASVEVRLRLDPLFASLHAGNLQTPHSKLKGDAKAIELLQSLQTEPLFENGAIEGTRHTETFDIVWDKISERDTKNLISKEQWVHESELEKHWFDKTNRSGHHKAFKTIQRRACTLEKSASVTDLERPFATQRQLAQYGNREVSIVEETDKIVIVRLAYQHSPGSFIQVTIDRKRKVVTAVANFNQWKKKGDLPKSVTLYSQYKKVAGVWWPTKIEHKNRDGKTTSLVTQKVRALSADEFAKSFRKFLPKESECLILSQPMPSIRDSHIAIVQEKATLAHHHALLLDDCAVQDWKRAATHVDAIEKLAKGKSATKWIRLAFLKLSVQHEQAADLIDNIVKTLLPQKQHGKFLANHLYRQAAGVLDHNEILRLLDKIKPIYDRQDALIDWQRLQVQQLRSLGDPRTIELQKEIAVAEPWDSRMQTRYAQDLKESGDLDAAIQWLQKQIDDFPGDRTRATVESHYGRIDQFLRGSGRSKQLVEFCQKRTEDNPESRSAMSAYLNALSFDGREEGSDKIAMQWMKDAQVDGELDLATKAKLSAAIDYALGQRPQYHLNSMHPKWHKPLAEVANFFLENEQHPNVASQVINNYRFRDSTEGDELYADIAKRIRKNAPTMSPKLLGTFLGWVANKKLLTEKQSKSVAKTIRQRWDMANDSNERRLLGNALAQLLSSPFLKPEHLPFLRRRVQRALEDGDLATAAVHRNTLYTKLSQQSTWTQEGETEAFELLKQLDEGQEFADPIPFSVNALFQLVDTMYAKRVSTASKNADATEHPEELTRQQLARQKVERRKEARLGLAATLGEHATGDDELSGWFLLEQIHQQVTAGKDLDAAAKECWRIVGDAPTRVVSTQEMETLDTAARGKLISKELRKERALDVLTYLAVRRSSTKRLLEKLLTYLDAGAKLNVDDPTPWRYRQFELLVSLDRTEQLTEKLRRWIASDSFPVLWQSKLALLQAELGEVADAIRLMESAKQLVRLSSQESSSLAKWYLVSDQESNYHEAKYATYATTPDHEIANWLNQKLSRLTNAANPGPTELDDKVLDAISALMRKATQPQQHVNQLMGWYRHTRDFRLLEMLPESVMGRSPQSVYAILQSISTDAMRDILKEATLDKISEHIEELRAGELSTLDARALDLLEVLVHRHAADVFNEPGPHIVQAKEAMTRAFDRGDWKPGEIKQMATLLGSLNKLSQPELRNERLRQYRELKALTQPGTEDRFYVSWKLAHSIAWSDGNRDGGIAEMQVAIADYKQQHPNGFPVSSNQPLFDYIQMLTDQGRFAAAEEFSRQQVKTAINSGQRIAFITKLNNTLVNAVRNRGQVSLGSGEELYQAVRQRLTKQAVNAVDGNERGSVLSSILQLFWDARKKGFENVDDHFWTFVSKKLPSIAAKQTNDRHPFIRTVATQVDEQLGGLKALEFTVIMLETNPNRWHYSWNRIWDKFAQRLDRHKGNLGRLEQRILNVLLAELELDLNLRQNRSRACYSRTSGYFWEEKADAFAAKASEVFRERKESGRHTDYIGRYFYEHLNLYERGIEIMLEAHERQKLTVDGKSMLALYLTNQERAKEAVPILKEIIAHSPDTLYYRIQLLSAYAATKQSKQWDATLKTTDDHFRQRLSWDHYNMGDIGQACLDAKRFQPAVDYYKEAMSSLRRNPSHPNTDQYSLSGYYQKLADAYVGLENTAKAVDAISAAMIVWRKNRSQLGSLGYSLEHILRQCKDLKAYIKSVDRQAEKTGMDSPMIRKQLGKVLLRKRRLPEAEKQLRAALQLQPSDVETHKELIELYQARQDTESAIDQMLKLIDIEKHNLDNYRQLVNRVPADSQLWERAITTIIEAAPNEAEHHQAVAVLREQKGNLDQAIGHWKQVAKLRELEPTGLIGLAKAQIAAKRIDDAKSTLQQIEDTKWDPRFSNVKSELQQMRQSMK